MSLFSINFLIFLIVVFAVNYALPSHVRYIWILFSSYLFYASWNLRYTVILIIVTLISYVCGIIIGNRQNGRRAIAAMGIALILSILCIFKLWRLIWSGMQIIFGINGLTGGGIANIVAPIGLSFFALVAIGYIVDVYREKITSEHNVLKYALFISFFPTVLSGPIERSTNLLSQIRKPIDFKYSNVVHGLEMMLGGYFLKLLIANRLSLIVDGVFDTYMSYGGLTLAIIAIIYAFQLYADFSGYSLIAIGIAKTLGFNLSDNFKQPYMSKSIKEFWGRWHISLSTWLRDYVYIPLGGNRRGLSRKYINLLVTFIVSGLWHGIGLQYVIWGLIHGAYQVGADAIGRVESINNLKNKDSRLIRGIQIIGVFILVDFAWIFFRSASLTEAMRYIFRIFCFSSWNLGELAEVLVVGNATWHFAVVVIEVIMWLTISFMAGKGRNLSSILSEKSVCIRWTIYCVMCLVIIIGIVYDYGTSSSNFIYAAF